MGETLKRLLKIYFGYIILLDGEERKEGQGKGEKGMIKIVLGRKGRRRRRTGKRERERELRGTTEGREGRERDGKGR